MSFVKLLVAFIVLFGFFSLLEGWYTPQKGSVRLRPGFWLDIAYWFFMPTIGKGINRSVLMTFIIIVALALGIPLQELQDRSYLGWGWLGSQPSWLQTIEIFLLADFINYWVHRSLHCGKWWPIHAIHHSSTDLDWLSSVRLHPFNELINTLCITLPILGLGYNPFLLAAYQPFLSLYAIMLHARLPWDFGFLGYGIVSPAFHRWHHSKEAPALDKNFAGLFAFWDVLFGTFYLPKNAFPHNFGTIDRLPQNLWGQLLHPFRRQEHF